jgi:hypothetical protein
LLKADVSTEGSGWDDAQIAEALETSLSTVYRTRRQLVEEGLEAALARKTQSTPPPRIFDGEKEAKLIALACSEPPKANAAFVAAMEDVLDVYTRPYDPARLLVNPLLAPCLAGQDRLDEFPFKITHV